MSGDSSSGEDDDDIPGLESVSSSEYVDESDDETKATAIANATIDCTKSKFYVTAKEWLQQDPEVVSQHFNLITIYMYSPFLYGHSNQSDKWLGWCHQVGLLASDVNYNTGELNNRELCALDVLDLGMQWCRRTLHDVDNVMNLIVLLQLMECLEGVETVEGAVKLARTQKWITDLANTFDGSTCSGNANFVEIGCLYVFNETAEYVKRYMKTQQPNFMDLFRSSCNSEEKNSAILIHRGDDLREVGDYDGAVRLYSDALICCPFSHRVYSLRARCYAKLDLVRHVLGDHLRFLYLQPDLSESYCNFVESLKLCGLTERAKRATNRFHAFLPKIVVKERVPQPLPRTRAPKPIRKERGVPTEKDGVMKDRLMRVCKQASEACLKNDDELALYYYEDAVRIAEEDTGWQKCLGDDECVRFVISLYYTYGCTLLRKKSYETARLALRQFRVVNSEYSAAYFPGTLWGAAKAYIILHRHQEALQCVREGKECVALYRYEETLTWPGLAVTIADCQPQHWEVQLNQLLDQCQPLGELDAVCRYSNCLQHMASNSIRVHGADYKGHMVLGCSENCAIAYHMVCWKRYKAEEEFGTEKDHLMTACPTPDCGGFITVIKMFTSSTGEAAKQFEASQEAIAARKHPSLPPTPTATTAPSGPAQKFKPSGRKPDRSRRKWKDEKERDTAMVAESSLSQKTPTLEERPLVEADVVVGKPAEVRRDSAISEDVRKPEDMISVINRQAELEEKELPKLRMKKKKTKAREKEGVPGSQEICSELFTLPQRQGMMGEASYDDSRKWQPDPEAPFQPPEHLREAIKDFEDTEVPGMGLKPRPLPLGSVGAATGGGSQSGTQTPEATPPGSAPSDLDFIYSYFLEVFRSNGALHPNDPILSEALTLLPDDKKLLVETAGGLRRFLLRSPNFKNHGNVLCLSEDAFVVAASIVSGSTNVEGKNTTSTKPTSVSTNGVSKDSKPSLSTLINEHQGDDLSGSQVGGTVNSGRWRFEEDGMMRNSKTYGEELGSGVNSPSSQTPPGSSPDFLSPEASPQVKKKFVVEEQSTKRLPPAATKTAAAKNARAPRERAPGKTSSLSQSDSGSQGTLATALATREDSVSGSSANGDRVAMATASRKEEGGSKAAPLPKGKERESKNKRRKDRKKEEAERAREGWKHAETQTWAALTIDQWVMTDPIPPVESFKEKYEEVLREKRDLQEKLEESGDRLFKLQRDHRREVEKVQQQSWREAKEEGQLRISDLERRLQEAKDREKKDQIDQIRSLKSEVKSLLEKNDKLKKDMTKKEQQMDQNFQEHHAELERLLKEKRRAEDRARFAQETQQGTLRRAVTSELELLSLRRDTVMRPREQQLQEVERMCVNIPTGTDFHRDMVTFRDKLRTAMECLQGAMDDQFRQVKEGKELASLERIPIPTVTPPPSLLSQRMPMMRPPFIPVPMVRGPVHPIPRPPPAHLPPPIELPPGSGPVGMVPAGPAGMIQPPRGAKPMPSGKPGDHPPMASPVHLHEPHTQADMPVMAAVPSTASRVKSSFDRIVEKLAPKYPHYTREDFKGVLREVRKNNKNTLSGLSLDSIAQQVEIIVDTRDMERGGPGAVGIGRDRMKGKKHTLPPVAVAPPPVQSAVEYDDDGSCIICYEDMGDPDSCKLSCGHRFHTDCIRSWFREQNTCPTCRNYALLTDDYPYLKHQ